METATVQTFGKKNDLEEVKDKLNTKEDAQDSANMYKKTKQALPDEPYQDILIFSESGEVSIFKNKSQKTFVSIRINWSRENPVVCALDTSDVSILIRADVYDLSWLDSIRQRDVLGIQRSSDKY